jgi:hypothetical protein
MLPVDTPAPVTAQADAPVPFVAPATVTVANVDVNGVFWGTLTKNFSDLKAGDFVFGDPQLPTVLPAGVNYFPGPVPDNTPGMYSIVAAPPQLVPLPPTQQPAAPATPSAERALYELAKAMYAASSAAVPQPTLDWAVSFETSLDAQVNPALTFFRKALGLLKS